MAQLNNLIVTGSSRFLNVINGTCTDGTAGTTKFMRQDGTWQVPPNDNTDTKVTQTATSADANYEVLFSGTADNTTRTEGAGKSSGFIYNPNDKSVLVGSLVSYGSLGLGSTAFGSEVNASGNCAHAEGSLTTADGNYSHAEGLLTQASGEMSHAEGEYTIASGPLSHAEGYYSTANHAFQHVFGVCNILDDSSAESTSKGNYIEIVGNGTASNARSNARTLDWSGNEWILGNLTLGSTTSDIILNGTNNKWDGTNTSLKSALAGKLSTSTTYAGSSSVGGAATSANKLNSDNGQKGGNGTPDIPVYFSGGKPQPCKIRIWTGSIAGNTDKVIDCAYGFVCVGRYYGGDRLWAGFVDQWGDGAMAIKATNASSHCAVTVNTKGSKITISNKSSNYMSYFVIGSPTKES